MKLSRDDMDRIEQAPAFFVGRSVARAASAPVGPFQAAPHVAEAIIGFEAFAEGDDPRKLDQRLSELHGTDIGREYEQPRLPTILVILDGSLIAGGAEILYVGNALATTLSLGLLRGGHSVVVHARGRAQWQVPDNASARTLSAYFDGHARSSRKSQVITSLQPLPAAGHVCLVTDAFWPRRAIRRLSESLGGLAPSFSAYVLTPEREYRGGPSGYVIGPGKRRCRPAPRDPERAMQRLLTLFARRINAAGGQLTVLRWDDRRRVVRRLLRNLGGTNQTIRTL